MSRISDRAPDRTPVELAAAEATGRQTYDPIPRHKGLDAAVKRIHELFGITVTAHYLRRATNSRRLVGNEICHYLHFSDRALFDFVVLSTRIDLKEPRNGRAP